MINDEAVKQVSILFKGGGISTLDLDSRESLEKTVEVLKQDMMEREGLFELVNKRLGIAIIGRCEDIAAIITKEQ